jgi:CubicO group peptidase (beta-lactamase class C family)
MRHLARTGAIALLALLALTACATAPRAARDLAATKTGLDGYLAAQVAPQRIPGLVAMIVDSRQTLYVGAFGSQDIAAGRPMRADSIFRIASMTKPVTSTLAMMLVEEGRLGLDDPVSKYLPEFASRPVMATFDPVDRSYTTRPPARAMTIRHLLTHTSGLGYPFSNTTLAALAAGTNTPPADYPLLHDPGARWTYGESTRVLGRVVEKVTGVGLEQLMRTRLFEPLGMSDTSYTTPARQAARVATIHRRIDGRLQEQPNAAGDIASPVQGDGGLNSTAADYAKFIQLFLNKGVAPDGRRLLGAKSVELMGRNHTGTVRVERQPGAIPAVSEPFPLGAGRDTYGLGFQVTGKPGDAGLRHPGSLSWAGIFNTEFWIDPEAGLGGILLMQYLPFYDPAAIDTLQGFERRAYAAFD